MITSKVRSNEKSHILFSKYSPGFTGTQRPYLLVTPFKFSISLHFKIILWAHNLCPGHFPLISLTMGANNPDGVSCCIYL